MSEIPIPQDTGSIGGQVASDQQLSITNVDHPFKGIPLVQAYEGLAADQARSLGGLAVARITFGAVAQLSQDKNDLKDDVIDLRVQIGSLTESLTLERVKSARLEERVGSFDKERRIGQACTFIGTALGSIAIDQFSSQEGLAIVLALFGAGLLVFGWFGIKGRKAP